MSKAKQLIQGLTKSEKKKWIDKSLKDLFGNEYLSESRYTYSREISYHDWFSTKTQNYIRSRDKKMKNKSLLIFI